MRNMYMYAAYAFRGFKTLLEEQANLVDANAKEEKKKDSEWIREIQIREEQKKAIEDWKVRELLTIDSLDCSL